MKFIIAAGGTGGHIYPAISFAQFLLKQKHEVKFISSNNAVAHEILEPVNLDVTYITLSGLNRSIKPRAIYQNFKTSINLVRAFKQTKKIISTFNPDVCIGFGSYITYPVIKIAKQKGIKTVIHEQNSYPGLVNRKLAPKVDILAYTYKSSLDYFKDVDKNKLLYSSNPRIADLTPGQKGDKILILGGSLGASFINDLAIELANYLPNQAFTLVSGSRNQVLNPPKNLEVINFSDQLLNLIRDAQLVITRAGATTLLECCALLKNTIAIPSPNVVANHQETNAKELASAGHLRYINEKEANVETVVSLINQEFEPKPITITNPNQVIYNKIKQEF